MHTETGKVIDNVGLLIPIRLLINVFHIGRRWVAKREEAVSNSNGAQTVSCHRINHSVNDVLTLFRWKFNQSSCVIKKPAASTKFNKLNLKWNKN